MKKPKSQKSEIAELSPEFLSHFWGLRIFRIFEYILLAMCTLLGFLAILAFSFRRVPDGGKIADFLETLFASDHILGFSSFFMIGYVVLITVYYLFFDRIKANHDREQNMIKGKFQGLDYKSDILPQDVYEILRDYQKLSTPIFGRGRKGVLVNLAIGVMLALTYLAFAMQVLGARF